MQEIGLTLEITCCLVLVAGKGHLGDLRFQLIQDFSVYFLVFFFCIMSVWETHSLAMDNPLTGDIAHLVVFKDGDAILVAGTVLSSGDKGITYRIGLANYTRRNVLSVSVMMTNIQHPLSLFFLLHLTITVDSFPSLRTIAVVVFSWRSVAAVWQSTTH